MPSEVEARVIEYERAFPPELRRALGGIIAPFVERDLEDRVYTDTLCDLYGHLHRSCPEIHVTPPLWTETGGRACMLSYIDNLRRDVRHPLRHALTKAGVLRSPEHDVSYVPFQFSATTEHAVDIVSADLHHLLVTVSPILENYVPHRRPLQKRVERAFSNAPELRRWQLDRVEIGHADADPRYVTSPTAFHDAVLRLDAEDGYRAILSKPQQRLLTRETHVDASATRCVAKMSLNVHILATHRDTRKRVQMTYSFTPFAFEVEMARSPNYGILRQPGLTMRIRPGTRTIATLRPAQWASLQSSYGMNIPRVAIWAILHDVVTRCREECDVDEYLRRLDASIADHVTLSSLREVLPEHVLAEIDSVSTTTIPATDLRRLPDIVETAAWTPIRAKKMGARVQLSHPLFSKERMCVKFPDGSLWVHAVLHDWIVAATVLRIFVNAMIVSNVLDADAIYDVTYVSDESMHDTHY